MCVGLSCSRRETGNAGEMGMGDTVSRAKLLRRKVMRSRISGRSWPEEQRHFLFHNRIENRVNRCRQRHIWRSDGGNMRYCSHQITFIFSVHVLSSHHMNVKTEEVIKDLKRKKVERWIYWESTVVFGKSWSASSILKLLLAWTFLCFFSAKFCCSGVLRK